MDMQQPIEPNRQFAPTLTAQQWEVVLQHLDMGQHRIVRPIIDSLMAQLQQQAQPQWDMQTERVTPDGP